MSSVVLFPNVPSEFTGMDGEQIDRHPLRAYMQGFVAGMHRLSEGEAARQDRERSLFQRTTTEAFLAGAKAMAEIAPPAKPKATRGRRRGSRKEFTWGDLRSEYIWLMRRMWVHHEKMSTACSWLAVRLGVSAKTVVRRYQLVRTFLNTSSAENADVLRDAEHIKHTLLLEYWRHRKFTAEDLKLTDPAAIEKWRTFVSPLPADPKRRVMRRSARDK
jgi:hypothetical protein